MTKTCSSIVLLFIPAALPSWAEMDYFDGTAWLNATPVTNGSFRDDRQSLQV